MVSSSGTSFGSFSGDSPLDRLVARGLVDSALPGAAAMIRMTAALTRCGKPVYLLRLWLAAARKATSAGAGQALEPFLPLETLVPFAGPTGLVIALLLAAGLTLRPVALVLMDLVLGMKIMELAQIDNVHYLALLFAGFALYGAGALYLEGLISANLGRRSPQLERRPAFDLEGLPRVVGVGAGFGGLACVKTLRDGPIDITP